MTYPFPDPPPSGAIREVAEGVFWVRMPLPFALNHINLWLLADEEGWTMVDAGLGNDETRELWDRIFEAWLDARPLARLVITHFHPDHIGLARQLGDELGLVPWMTQGEYLHAHAVFHRIAGTDFGTLDRWYARHGLDRDRREALAARDDPYRRNVRGLPERFRRIQNGEEIVIGGAVWRVLVGRGHSPEHAALYCAEKKVLISGDMLLPRITTNVSVWPMEPEADPVGEFLRALDDFAALPSETLVLPSHGLPFRGAGDRVAQLRRHHRARLEKLAAVCRQPRTAAELLPDMFERRLDERQIPFAMGETIAHLNSLVHRGALTRIEDAQGVYRFVARAAHSGTGLRR